MIKFRLEIARTYLDDAMMLFNEKRFNSAASRAYYASYQAMWAALGVSHHTNSGAHGSHSQRHIPQFLIFSFRKII